MNFRHLQKLSVLYNTVLRAKRFPSPDHLLNSAISEPIECALKSQSSALSSSKKVSSNSTCGPKLQHSVKKRYSGIRNSTKLTRSLKGSAKNGQVSKKKLKKSSAIREETRKANRIQCSARLTPFKKSQAWYTEEVKLKKIPSFIRNYKNYDSQSFLSKSESGLRLVSAVCNAEYLLRKDQIRNDFDGSTTNKKKSSCSTSSKKMLNPKAIIPIKEPRRFYSTKKPKEKVTASRNSRRSYSKTKTDVPSQTEYSDKDKKRVYPPHEKTRQQPGEKHPDESSNVRPEPPCVDEPQGCHYYKRIVVKGEDGESTGYVVNKVYFRHPYKVEHKDDLMKTTNKYKGDEDFEYVKAVVTKTIEQRAQEEHRSLVHKLPNKNCQNLQKTNNVPTFSESEIFNEDSPMNEKEQFYAYTIECDFENGEKISKQLQDKFNLEVIAYSADLDKMLESADEKTCLYFTTELLLDGSSEEKQAWELSLHDIGITLFKNEAKQTDIKTKRNVDTTKTPAERQISDLILKYQQAWEDDTVAEISQELEEKYNLTPKQGEKSQNMYFNKYPMKYKNKSSAPNKVLETKKNIVPAKEEDEEEVNSDPKQPTLLWDVYSKTIKLIHKLLKPNDDLEDLNKVIIAELNHGVSSRQTEEKQKITKGPWGMSLYEFGRNLFSKKNTADLQEYKPPQWPHYKNNNKFHDNYSLQPDVKNPEKKLAKRVNSVQNRMKYTRSVHLENRTSTAIGININNVYVAKDVSEVNKLPKTKSSHILTDYNHERLPYADVEAYKLPLTLSYEKNKNAEELPKTKSSHILIDYKHERLPYADLEAYKLPLILSNEKNKNAEELLTKSWLPEKKDVIIEKRQKYKISEDEKIWKEELKSLQAQNVLKEVSKLLKTKSSHILIDHNYERLPYDDIEAYKLPLSLSNKKNKNAEELSTKSWLPEMKNVIIEKRQKYDISEDEKIWKEDLKSLQAQNVLKEVSKLPKTKSSHILFDPNHERLPYDDIEAYKLPLSLSNEKNKNAEELSTKSWLPEKKNVSIFPQLKDKEDDTLACIGTLKIMVPTLKVPYVFQRKADVLKNESSRITDSGSLKNSSENSSALIDRPIHLDRRVERQKYEIGKVEKIFKEELKSLQARKVLNEESLEDKKEQSHEDRQKANFSKFVGLPQKVNACSNKNLGAAKNEEKTEAETNIPRRILRTSPSDLRFNMKSSDCNDCTPQCPTNKNPYEKETTRVKDICDKINDEAKFKPPGQCPSPKLCNYTSWNKKEDPCTTKNSCKKKPICCTSKDNQITRKKSTSSSDSNDMCKNKDPFKRKSKSACNCQSKNEDPCKKKATASSDCSKKEDSSSSDSNDMCKNKDPFKRKSKSACNCQSKNEDPCKKKATESSDCSKKEDSSSCDSNDMCKNKDPFKRKSKSACYCQSKNEDPCKKKATASSDCSKKEDSCKKKS